MTLRTLIDNGILCETSQINVNDELFGTFFCVEFSDERDQDELVIGFLDEKNLYFPLDFPIEIEGLELFALDNTNNEFTLAFEKISSIDPDMFSGK